MQGCQGRAGPIHTRAASAATTSGTDGTNSIHEVKQGASRGPKRHRYKAVAAPQLTRLFRLSVPPPSLSVARFPFFSFFFPMHWKERTGKRIKWKVLLGVQRISKIVFLGPKKQNLLFSFNMLSVFCQVTLSILSELNRCKVFF